ncbi:MAG: FISUMP domain-containing protein, partial [Chitinivibrionales bacterium]|nr:FISUMP domain-containing protein [Chitinivibrionales bacterium]
MHFVKLLSAVLLALSACFAGNVNICGVVTAKDGGGAIAGAAVRLETGGQTATTGSDGHFTLTGSPAAAKDVIIVTQDGYLNYHMAITNSDTSGLDIKMIVCAGTVTDIEGNTYQSVKIGNQIWTTDNLRTTKYNDGKPIDYVTGAADWTNIYYQQKGGYCYYNNSTDTAVRAKFGALYNAYAIVPGKLSPA